MWATVASPHFRCKIASSVKYAILAMTQKKGRHTTNVQAATKTKPSLFFRYLRILVKNAISRG